MPKLKDGHLRHKKNGVWEIRYRQLGYDKSFSNKDCNIVKGKFKEFINSLNSKVYINKSSNVMFDEWASKYLYEIKQPTIKAESFNSYKIAYNNYILPALKDIPIKDIKPIDIQKLVNEVLVKGVTRILENIKIVLNGIFNSAIANKIISDSPMLSVIIPKHQRINGKAITKDEEKAFLNQIKGRKYEFACYLMLYTGMRKAELLQLTEESFDFKNNIIICPCAKQKGIQRQKTYRNIPIFPKLKAILPNYLLKIKELITINSCEFTKFFKDICPNHHLHELRHTFVTRARECGIDRDIVSIWTGHSLGSNMTSSVYTHYSVEYMQKQALKLIY